MNEKILGYLTEYFQMNDFFKKFYEIIFTNERIIMVNSGETFRSWIARADVAYSKRQKLINMDLKDIYNNFEDKDLEIIYYKDIQNIVLSNKTFIKSGKIHIKLNKGDKVYYTNKENAIEEFKETFNVSDMPFNINFN